MYTLHFASSLLVMKNSTVCFERPARIIGSSRRQTTEIWILWVRPLFFQTLGYSLESSNIDHPINAIALTRSPSIPLLFSSGRSNPPTAWTSQPQPDSLAFPSPQLPLTHTPSTSSTTSTSTYKVTLHRRRIHSRTSFPEANRALDHLHSSSPIAALDSPSDSPHSSSECLDRPHAEVAPNAIPVKPTGISKIRNQNNATPGTVFPPKGRWPQSQRGQPPPSLLPPRSSARQPPAQKTVAEVCFRFTLVVPICQ